MAKQRIVVKIGSSLLANKSGGLSHEKLSKHVERLAFLKKQGYEVILISSGAVAAGYSDMGYPVRPVTLSGKQATAAVGQGLLVQAYTEAFKSHNIHAAQLLLTRNVFANEAQYSNVYRTLSELLKRQMLPIINENDSVAVNELTFGDNDMLSALVSGLVHADFLMIMTDINGLYNRDPRANKDAERIDFIHEVSDDWLRHADQAASSKLGTGGMTSKLLAARTALSLGVPSFIGAGHVRETYLHILDNKGDGTYIGERKRHNLQKPKQWIAFHSEVSGSLMIDKGAEAALREHGKSLLPAGLKAYEGAFSKGDVVKVLNMTGEPIGRGQVNYNVEDIAAITGLESKQAMEKVNGQHPEVIHRDRFVLSFPNNFKEDSP